MCPLWQEFMETTTPSSMNSCHNGHEVKKLFDVLGKKIKESGTEEPELNEEFAKLREITNNYTVPGDVCESYEAVYKMLAELDQAYQA